MRIDFGENALLLNSETQTEEGLLYYDLRQMQKKRNTAFASPTILTSLPLQSGSNLPRMTIVGAGNSSVPFWTRRGHSHPSVSIDDILPSLEAKPRKPPGDALFSDQGQRLRLQSIVVFSDRTQN